MNVDQVSNRPTKRHTAMYFALVVGAVAAVLLAVLATRTSAPGSIATSTLGGKRAPSITGTALIGGERIGLGQLGGRNRYVLVDFFASWCVPCQQEMRQLEAFHFHEGSKVALLGVDIDDSSANGAGFLRHYGAQWPAIEDTLGSGSASVAYGVTNPGELFLIAPNGKVAAFLIGAPTINQLEAALVAAKNAVRTGAY